MSKTEGLRPFVSDGRTWQYDFDSGDVEAVSEREPYWGAPINEQDAKDIEEMRRAWWQQKHARDAQRAAQGADETARRLEAVEGKLALIMVRLGIDG